MTVSDSDAGGWLFAYGSLMWDPGVPVAEAVPARLPDYRRSFCLISVCHRGTPDCPGLVLGLDPAPGDECTGLALRIAGADWPEALAAVRERELVTEAYREALLPVDLRDGRNVSALTYVMRTDHWQYAGGLDLARQAEMIAAAIGGRGRNLDYLTNFLRHLEELGIAAADFDELGRLAAAADAQAVVLGRQRDAS